MGGGCGSVPRSETVSPQIPALDLPLSSVHGQSAGFTGQNDNVYFKNGVGNTTLKDGQHAGPLGCLLV